MIEEEKNRLVKYFFFLAFDLWANYGELKKKFAKLHAIRAGRLLAIFSCTVYRRFLKALQLILADGWYTTYGRFQMPPVFLSQLQIITRYIYTKHKDESSLNRWPLQVALSIDFHE